MAEAVRSASVTRSVVVARDALGGCHRRRGARAARRCQIVADANTMAAAGQRVLALLRAASVPLADPIVLEDLRA
jgi:hypothetical protein